MPRIGEEAGIAHRRSEEPGTTLHRPESHIQFQTYAVAALKQARKLAGQAARLLGINRTYLYQLLSRHRKAIGFRASEA